MFKCLTVPGHILTAIGILVIASSCAMKESGVVTMKGAGAKSLTQNGEGMPVSNELAQFLSENNIVVLALINDRGEVIVVNPVGKQVEPCGIVEGTRITGTCDLNMLSLEYINQLSILATVSNPRCMTIKVDGTLMKVHRGGDGYPRGADPCHRDGH
jgi:hypothetical protein